MNKFYILGTIEKYWGTSAANVQWFLNQNMGQDVEIVINSPGGYIDEGVAIHNLLKNHDGKVTTRAVGQAASVASVIFCAGEERIIEAGAWVMVHKPGLEWVSGTADKLRDAADYLDEMQAAIMEIYNGVVVTDKAAFEGLVNKETWILGKAAVDHGIATQSAITYAATACAGIAENNKFNYKNAPADMATQSQNQLNEAKANLKPEETAPEAENIIGADKPAETNNTEPEVHSMELNQATAEDVLRDAPDVHAAIVKTAVAEALKTENARVEGIKALAKMVDGSPEHVTDAINAEIELLCKDPAETAATATAKLFVVASKAQNTLVGSIGDGARGLGEDLNQVPAGGSDTTTITEETAQAKVSGMVAGYSKKK